MFNKLEFIPAKHRSLILLLEFLILPLPIALFLNLSPTMVYAGVTSAFILIFIPGFAVTSFLKDLTTLERMVLSLAFGLLAVSSMMFLLGKLGSPINNFVFYVLLLPLILLICINRKNLYSHRSKDSTSDIDFYDLLAVSIAILSFLMMLITISIQPTPYGEADASWHYYVSNYIREENKLPDVVPKFSSPVFGGEKYTYPPLTHINMALFGSLLNIPQLYSPYIYIALLHAILGLSIYVLVKKHFGKIEAVGTLVFIVVAKRLLFSMLIGQWAYYTALATLPISMFLIIRFFREQNIKNAVMLGLLFGLQLYAHPLIAGQSVLIFVIYGIFWSLINRKIPSKFYIVPIVSLIAIPGLLSPQTFDTDRFELPKNFYSWYPVGEYDSGYLGGYPVDWFSFSQFNQRVLYFSIAGIVAWFLFFRKEYLLISFLISLFVLLHLPTDKALVVRFMVNESIVMAILAGISFSLLKIFSNKNFQTFVPFIVIAILVIFVYSDLSHIRWYLYAFSGQSRMAEDEFNLLKSMKYLPEGKTFYFGYYEFARQAAWAPHLSEHIFYFPDVEDINGTLTISFQNNTEYLFLSFSHVSPKVQSLMVNFHNLLVEQGCEELKSYHAAMLLSADCLKTNKLSLKYELL